MGWGDPFGAFWVQYRDYLESRTQKVLGVTPTNWQQAAASSLSNNLSLMWLGELSPLYTVLVYGLENFVWVVQVEGKTS